MIDGDPTLFDSVEPTDGEALDRHVTSAARPVEEGAHARWTDPITSHAAAATVTIHALRASQLFVVQLLTDNGPSTLEELVDGAAALEVGLSDSRVRTACAELVDLGYVADSGDRRTTRRGRAAVVWHLTPQHEGDEHP